MTDVPQECDTTPDGNHSSRHSERMERPWFCAGVSLAAIDYPCIMVEHIINNGLSCMCFYPSRGFVIHRSNANIQRHCGCVCYENFLLA